MTYLRPILARRADVGPDALQLAGGVCWFDRVEVITRSHREIVSIATLSAAQLEPFIYPRSALSGVSMNKPRLMGILNVTPDSFSDGGQFQTLDTAVAHAHALGLQGADILDIGGESTRPGAQFVPADVEIARTAPIVRALARAANTPPISIDTRKAAVAQAALGEGAAILNDVSAMSYDPDMVHIAAQSGAPLCLMHALGDPKTMQDNPEYDNVVLDVYDYLQARIEVAVAAGVQRSQIIVDPGIGFGKTLDHNLKILRDIAVYHSLGCCLLLGASRKRFIGNIGGAHDAAARMPGSVAVALAGAAQGVQIIRVHDVAETHQALSLWQAVR